MEDFSCDICFAIFSEVFCVPKVLDCGHTLCYRCLRMLLRGQKTCPTCRGTLAKSLEEYPTNFILLNKVAMHNSLEDERKPIMEETNRLPVALGPNLTRSQGNTLHLNQYKNDKHFLYDLAVRLQNNEMIYACEMIGTDGQRYGEITYSQERLNIHCLSSSRIDKTAFVVSLCDLRKCIISKEDIVPFIRIGNQDLIFTLTDHLTLETLRLIKLFTGEGGQTMKGLKLSVERAYPETTSSDSSALNFCRIPLTPAIRGAGYEHALYQNNFYKMDKDDVILQSLKREVHIYKVPDLTPNTKCFNVVGKLIKDSQIDFNKMINKRVEDTGISFII